MRENLRRDTNAFSQRLAEKRGGYGEEKYEKREMQLRVRSLFMGLLDGEGEESKMRVVYAGESAEVVGELVLKEVTGALERVAGGEKLGRVTMR